MRWDPWAEAERRPHLRVALAALPPALGGAVWWPRGDRAAIVVDPALAAEERTAALAHELVHDERGGGADRPGMPACWGAVVARDEAAVDAEVARRLVPGDELAAVAAERAAAGDGLSPSDVAVWFEVPLAVAARALATLVREASTAGD
jgi:hypothetical protein